MNNFLSKHGWILSGLLIAQAAIFYGLSRGENVPVLQPLSGFSTEIGPWRMEREMQHDKDTLDVLRADDLLSRAYVDAGRAQLATLFVAFFRTQRAGQAPHSPKNCLPGNGWMPMIDQVIPVSIAGQPEPIHINKYLIARGEEKSVVLYWYQTHNRVVASEYTAKFFLVVDSIRLNRSDTALVRVVVPVARNDEQAASDTAIRFVQDLFKPLKAYLPS